MNLDKLHVQIIEQGGDRTARLVRLRRHSPNLDIFEVTGSMFLYDLNGNCVQNRSGFKSYLVPVDLIENVPI